MNSPAFPFVVMKRVTLAEGLSAWECSRSGGHYIAATDYETWLAKHDGELPETPETHDETQDTTHRPSEPSEQRARLCPETGRLMVRYRVGKGIPFSIDRSPTGGIWLDKGEWESLRSRNLHDEIHHIFAAPWQKEVRDEQRVAGLRQSFEARIGKEGFAEAERFKQWLKQQPDSRAVIAYLLDPEA
jgi:Zn-finger nucleic acid-binding protein